MLQGARYERHECAIIPTWRGRRLALWRGLPFLSVGPHNLRGSSLTSTIRDAESCDLILSCPRRFLDRCFVLRCRDWLRFVGLTPSFSPLVRGKRCST